MTDPVAVLFGAFFCWLTAGAALHIGWKATFQPGAMWIAWVCALLAVAFLAMSIALGILGCAGLLWAA